MRQNDSILLTRQYDGEAGAFIDNAADLYHTLMVSDHLFADGQSEGNKSYLPFESTLITMQIDVFQTPGNFPNNNPSLGCFYGLVASINYTPVIGSFICNIAQDKAYEVVQLCYSKDKDRTIVITVPQTFSIARIFDIHGDPNSPGPVDIFTRNGRIPDNAPNSSCSYGLVASVDYVPAIRSYFCNVTQDQVHEVTDVLYTTDGSRTIVLTVPVPQSVKNIFTIPGANG